MTPAFHDCHAGLVETISDPDRLEALVNAEGRRRDWWSDDHRWGRTWSRITDAWSGRVGVACERLDAPGSMCVLELAPGDAGAPRVIDAQLFPEDRCLPTLGAIMRAFPATEVVRYRPGKRCTLKHEGADADESVMHYLKVFPDGRTERLFEESRTLWQAYRAGRIDVAVAEPVAHLRRLRCVVQRAVPGVGVADVLLGPAGAGLAKRLGAAAGSIAASGIPTSSRFEPDDELVRFARRATELAQLVPAMRPDIARLSRSVTTRHADLTDRPLMPIHGSPHPSQWLIDGEDIGLVDFDRLSEGDPELDVATFAAEIDYERRGRHVGLVDDFAAGYESAVGPLDPDRLTVYRAHKRFAKVYRTAKSVRPDAPDKAHAHLVRALESLEGHP